MQQVRLGILGAGRIAHRMMQCAAFAPSMRIQAVAARDEADARSFAAQYGIPNAHGGYDALYADPTVDLIYIATPHPFHEAQTLAALAAGKHVLCEKSMAMSPAQVQRMAASAREKRLFLMEAMWTRFFPASRKVCQLIAEDAIGQPLAASVTFGFRTAFDPASRLFAKGLGGGAMLDLGVYVIAFASMIMGGGMPEAAGAASIGASGVDEVDAISLRYPGGGIASLQCATRAAMPDTARVFGSKGALEIPRFWSPDSLTLTNDAGQQTFAFPRQAEGFEYELEHVAHCIANGMTESPIMPLDESLCVSRTMDALLGQWGVSYDGVD